MDLERMRAQDATTEMLRFASENAERISWLDQDVLNVVFAKRWHALHPRWNTMNSFWNWTEWANAVFGETAVSEAKASPAVLHFEGPSVCKPWHYLSTHPLRWSYRKTLRRTPWGETPLSDRTMLTRLIGLLPERWRVRAYINVRGQQALE
jgi:lipopolysaccharide biosynthesis glycosyltransferase